MKALISFADDICDDVLSDTIIDAEHIREAVFLKDRVVRPWGLTTTGTSSTGSMSSCNKDEESVE